jgi:hypothetical protein
VSIELAQLLHEGITVAHDRLVGSNAHTEQLEDLIREHLNVAQTRAHRTAMPVQSVKTKAGTVGVVHRGLEQPDVPREQFVHLRLLNQLQSSVSSRHEWRSECRSGR